MEAEPPEFSGKVLPQPCHPCRVLGEREGERDPHPRKGSEPPFPPPFSGRSLLTQGAQRERLPGEKEASLGRVQRTNPTHLIAGLAWGEQLRQRRNEISSEKNETEKIVLNVYGFVKNCRWTYADLLELLNLKKATLLKYIHKDVFELL